jgi:(p)ppGpp synthase/HD superfamily hydrolase
MILSARYMDALRFAFELHGGQLRKGTSVPYFAHLIGTSSMVLENGGGEDEAIAALLHDAAEDQGGESTLRDIGARFGARVSTIVAECSDSFGGEKAPWRERKERYSAHLKGADASVQLVASCDKLYNARAILSDYRELGESLWSRFSGGREGVLWYYRALAETFTIRKPAVDERRRVVAEIVGLAGTLETPSTNDSRP